jgi:NAD+ synthase (glutamine-hydrolysing)
VVADIISDETCKGMIISLGAPVRHRNVRYNAQILCTYKHIYFIRPKMSLANDGLYREMRHFTPWSKPRQFETYYLEQVVAKVTGQTTVPIGDGILSTPETAIGVETCEELFTPLNPSTFLGLNGAEIILNSSASHAELRKLKTRLDLISNSTRKLGGIYVYANCNGVDGEARQIVCSLSAFAPHPRANWSLVRRLVHGTQKRRSVSLPYLQGGICSHFLPAWPRHLSSP